MSKISYTRRQFCRYGLGSVAGLTLMDLAACGASSSSAGGSQTLQLSFWGDASRNKLTRNAISLYQQAHSGTTIHSWFADFNSYFNKLNTQIAGGSVPDLIQMDMAYVSQYVNQKILLDLGPLISNKTIDLSDFDQGMLKNSEDKGVVYGISLGGNYECMIYDSQVVKDAGLSAPPSSWTWDDYAQYAGKISKALSSKQIYGSPDSSGAIDIFEIWVRQQGHELYTSDGGVAFTLDDVTSWFTYWSQLRKAGACAPAQLQASVTGSGPAATLLTQGKVAFAIAHSNQFHGFQVLSQHPYALQMVPNGPKPGLYLKPSMLMSVAAKSKYTKEAADFINFLITQPKGVKAIGLDRGIPGSARARAALQPTLKAEDKAVLAYASMVAGSGQTSSKTVLDPPNAGKLQTLLMNVAQAVGFGKQSAADGAKSFYDGSQKALAKS
ncbi:sugar ABC transporter substrate-binding protein [Dictyobacter sp. S3.2.2.5]|uniref:Sugar ABC transporter substrate-binding protein n=1 Tax=Dictyobacter halimunensis TaxID=3026934 RepID=A0ABQ6FZY0_9CHLR|nr:sugar ABC transporter substrate-binding protein [Dictyobacter sp. S3.2.2.5]